MGPSTLPSAVSESSSSVMTKSALAGATALQQANGNHDMGLRILTGQGSLTLCTTHSAATHLLHAICRSRHNLHMKGAREEIDDVECCSCTARCFVADPVRRAAHPELLLALAFWAGERPLPGAEELLVALLGAVCLEELDGRWAIGAA